MQRTTWLLLGIAMLLLGAAPPAAAGIPVPLGEAKAIAADGSATAGSVAEGLRATAAAVAVLGEVGASGTLASLGGILASVPGPGGAPDVDTGALVAAANLAREAALDGVGAAGTAGQDLAQRTAGASEGATTRFTEGSTAAAGEGILAAQGAVTSAQSMSASQERQLLQDTLPAASGSAGRVANAAAMGAVGVYNAHAAPAACVAAGVFDDVNGVVSTQGSCRAALLPPA